MGSKNAIPGKSSSGPSSQWAPGLNLLDASASSTNTYTSNTFNASNLDNIGLQVAFTGTMTGTFQVLCSIDNENFEPLSFTPALTQPSGSDLSYLVSLNQLPYPYLQVTYTNISGTGTVSVFLSGKDLN